MTILSVPVIPPLICPGCGCALIPIGTKQYRHPTKKEPEKKFAKLWKRECKLETKGPWTLDSLADLRQSYGKKDKQSNLRVVT